METSCKTCIHKKVCDLWREVECQSAKSFFEDECELYAEEQRWIPVTERLPEEDKEVLITYKGKRDELDKPYSNIDITTYGQMYFGGNKVGNYKHWRSPFQYFYENYEVTAWMPLPEPYKGGDA